MSHIHPLVWNDNARRCVQAPETARGRARGRAVLALAPVALLPGSPAGAQPLPPGTLPSGAKLMAGEARISQSGAQMAIDQASRYALGSPVDASHVDFEPIGSFGNAFRGMSARWLASTAPCPRSA